MNDLHAMYNKTLEITSKIFEDDLDEKGNFTFKPVQPKMSDISFLKELDPECYILGKTLVGDRGYISQSLQTDLFTHHKIELKVPYRKNQKDKKPLDPILGKKRRRIETQFSQLCDQFRLKHNYAKSFSGFLTRMMSKLAAIAVLQWVNLEKGRPLNHIKHAWS